MDAAPLLYATIIIAALLAVYLVVRSSHSKHNSSHHGGNHPLKSHFSSDVPSVLSQEKQALRAGHNKVLDAVRGKPDAADLRDAILSKYHLDRRVSANVRVEDIAEAERASWDSAHDSDGTAPYDPVVGSSPGGDSTQYHA